MAEPSPPSATELVGRRFLTFRLEERLYALPAEEVSEVIRTPVVARVPQGPKSLMGVANLRGSVLPVASLRGLLGRDEAGGSASSRAIVLDGAAPVALAVDGVDALVTIADGRVETEQATLAAHPGERLRGAFQTGEAGDLVKILDIRALLAEAFTQRPRSRRATFNADVGHAAETAGEIADHERFVAFEVAGQEYALGLDVVREIIPAPTSLAITPHGESLVLGVTAYRDGLLPVLSLAGLLGFGAAAPSDGRAKVLVTKVGGVLVGLLADRMRAVIAVDPEMLEPPPPVLAARMGGESRIKAIYRGDGGRRLISVLAPEQLFREDVMRNLSDAREAAASTARTTTPGQDGAARRQALFLVFRLGDDEFGLPIEAVDEVARVPERITRVPKTPRFLEGVVNLRGEVLPVVDQRRRFDMPKLENAERRRLVVVRTERHRAGLIVDSVSEVLRTEDEAIEEAPDLTGDVTRLVNGVINLEEAGRMVLLLDPAELLTRAERGLLSAFEATTRAADL
ncbi:MAG TPA: chemotaxis protein CheW [Caulobacteraceae bacterium]|jgi:purine-binding chemotaxis protein CheW|nr:chemotaxis protein CheW [Caulobacteraceae bacterium]